MALQVGSDLVARRAMREGDVVVGNVVEEMDLVLLQHKGGSDGVHGSIAPSLIEKSTVLVKALEEIDVCLRTQPIKVADLEVGPLIVVSACCIGR